MLPYCFLEPHGCLHDDIVSATTSLDRQSSSIEQLQPVVTPSPELCPGCQVLGGYATILAFPSSEQVDDDTELDPFTTKELIPLVLLFANGSNLTTTSTSTFTIPPSLSDLSTTDTIVVWTQFDTEL